jgi:hypothetical protein
MTLEGVDYLYASEANHTDFLFLAFFDFVLIDVEYNSWNHGLQWIAMKPLQF